MCLPDKKEGEIPGSFAYFEHDEVKSKPPSFFLFTRAILCYSWVKFLFLSSLTATGCVATQVARKYCIKREENQPIRAYLVCFRFNFGALYLVSLLENNCDTAWLLRAFSPLGKEKLPLSALRPFAISTVVRAIASSFLD